MDYLFHQLPTEEILPKYKVLYLIKNYNFGIEVYQSKVVSKIQNFKFENLKTWNILLGLINDFK